MVNIVIILIAPTTIAPILDKLIITTSKFIEDKYKIENIEATRPNKKNNATAEILYNILLLY